MPGCSPKPCISTDLVSIKPAAVSFVSSRTGRANDRDTNPYHSTCPCRRGAPRVRCRPWPALVWAPRASGIHASGLSPYPLLPTPPRLAVAARSRLISRVLAEEREDAGPRIVGGRFVVTESGDTKRWLARELVGESVPGVGVDLDVGGDALVLDHLCVVEPARRCPWGRGVRSSRRSGRPRPTSR